jgi:hypothetical protein
MWCDKQMTDEIYLEESLKKQLLSLGKKRNFLVIRFSSESLIISLCKDNTIISDFFST